MPSTAALKIQDRSIAKKIPTVLIKEILDGLPIYYKGYKEVLSAEKTLDDIMGTSTLQFLLVSYLHWSLFERERN